MIHRRPQPDAPLFQSGPNRLGMPVAKFMAMRETLRHCDGPETERAPDESRINALDADALKFVRDAGDHGATFDEWAEARALDQSHSGRFTALHERGLIVDSKRTRTTRRGRAARVFVTAPPTEGNP